MFFFCSPILSLHSCCMVVNQSLCAARVLKTELGFLVDYRMCLASLTVVNISAKISMNHRKGDNRNSLQRQKHSSASMAVLLTPDLLTVIKNLIWLCVH